MCFSLKGDKAALVKTQNNVDTIITLLFWNTLLMNMVLYNIHKGKKTEASFQNRTLQMLVIQFVSLNGKN